MWRNELPQHRAEVLSTLLSQTPAAIQAHAVIKALAVGGIRADFSND